MPKPEFDSQKARELIGKHCLVGLTYCDKSGKEIEQKQFHGDIIMASEQEGIVLRLRPSGEEFKLPPDLRAFLPAKPGTYTLKNTGETVINPDLLTTWTINKPE